MGVGRRIDDDSVRIPVRRLNPVNDGALMVGLKQDRFNLLLKAAVIDKALQSPEILRPVDLRLPDTEHVEIRPVDDQKLHFSTSRIA